MFRKKTSEAPQKSLRKQFLFPKEAGLTGDNKPKVIILNSPFDPRDDKASKYSEAKVLADERGYTVLNKKEIVFPKDNRELKNFIEDEVIQTQKKFVAAKAEQPIDNLIKKVPSKNNEVFIWLETHGAPAWMFSGRDEKGNARADLEANGAIIFARFIRELENKTGCVVKGLILHACYSSSEIINPDKNGAQISPARIISLLLPNVIVLGFSGINAGAKVTELVEITEGKAGKNKGTAPLQDQYIIEGSRDALTLGSNQNLSFGPINLEDASMVFLDGKVIEMGNRKLYCTDEHIQPMVFNMCKLDEETIGIFKLCDAINEIELHRDKNLGTFQGQTFAEKQVNFFKSNKLEPNKIQIKSNTSSNSKTG